MPWHLEFYRTGSDGARTGGDRATDFSGSLDQASAKAKAILECSTFSFGRANLCVIKTQYGNTVLEVAAMPRGSEEKRTFLM